MALSRAAAALARSRREQLLHVRHRLRQSQLTLTCVQHLWRSAR
jgi:hypothetical protein